MNIYKIFVRSFYGKFVPFGKLNNHKFKQTINCLLKFLKIKKDDEMKAQLLFVMLIFLFLFFTPLSLLE